MQLFTWIQGLFKARPSIKEEPATLLPDDLTSVRHIQERLVRMNPGQKFGVASRGGMYIFQLVEIRNVPPKEKQLAKFIRK